VGDARQWRKDIYANEKAQKRINFASSRTANYGGQKISVGEHKLLIDTQLQIEKIKLSKHLNEDQKVKQIQAIRNRLPAIYNPFISTDVIHGKIQRDIQRKAERGFAKGGSVGGPSGTDTIPAWLSPGEFVVNARATQKNLPLLHSINAQKLAGGTPDNGNLLGNIGGFTAAIMTLTTSINALANLSSSMDKLSKLEIPQRIEIGGTYTVEVIHNGLEVLSGLDAKIKQILMENIDKATGINRVTGETSESFGQQQIA
jgi:hypothetical protein